MNNRSPFVDAAFSDDEKFGLNGSKFGLQALSNASPLLKRVLFSVVAVLTFSVLWGLGLDLAVAELAHAEAEEVKLKEGLAFKRLKVNKQRPLQPQHLQLLRDVESLELALSRKGDMASLLKLINQAGLGRGLQFELFRPEKEVITAHFAELPISLRVTGPYHHFGFFAADIASLPHLVTLDNLTMTPLKEGHLVFEASLHAYRHLETEERAVSQKSSTLQGRQP